MITAILCAAVVAQLATITWLTYALSVARDENEHWRAQDGVLRKEIDNLLDRLEAERAWGDGLLSSLDEGQPHD
jgi:hypothetical protein